MRTGTTMTLAVSLMCAGCSLGTAPEPSGHRYALMEVGDAPLPVRVGGESWLADTIRFGSAGGWTRVQVVVLHAEGSAPGPVRRESEGFVTRSRGRVVLDFDCGSGALSLCVAPDTLRFAGEGLLRRANRYGGDPGPDPEFRYEPIG